MNYPQMQIDYHNPPQQTTPNQQQRQSPYKILQQQKTYKVGNAVFRKQIKKRQSLRLLNGIMIQALQRNQWAFKPYNQEGKKQKWRLLFELMKQCNIQIFNYSNCQNPKILKQISHIKFNQVKQINLFNSGVQSYQPFSSLYCPKLQKINLIYNQHNNFKSFNKVNLPNVKIFCIYVSKPRRVVVNLEEYVPFEPQFSIGDISRCGFNLNELRLQKNQYDPVLMQDLSKLARQKQSLKQVYINISRRIRQQKVLQVLNRKQIKLMVVNNRTMDFKQLNYRQFDNQLLIQQRQRQLFLQARQQRIRALIFN